MIYSDRCKVKLVHPSQIEDYDDKVVDVFIEEEKYGALFFYIPPTLTTNREKATYKAGFLSAFLKLLYPEKVYADIIEIMNSRYHLFLGRRQIERYVKEYSENKKYQ
jgi:hypothetical protein